MKWNNLKNNKCPDCGKPLLFHTEKNKPVKIWCPCDFKISEKRMNEIVTSMNKKSVAEHNIREETQTQEELGKL